MGLTLGGLTPLLSLPLIAQDSPADDFGNEPFVIEKSSTTHRFENDGTGQMVVESRIRVQTEAGVQQLGQLLIPYLKGRWKVEIEQLRVLRPDGTVAHDAPDRIQNLPAPITTYFQSTPISMSYM